MSVIADKVFFCKPWKLEACVRWVRTNDHQKISHNKLLLVEYFQTAKNAMRAILPLTGQMLAVLNTNNEHGLKGSKNRQRWLTEDWISRPFTTQTSLLLETFF